MRIAIRAGAAILLAAAGVGVAHAELFVVRVGTGAAALSSASTATFIDRFNDDGTVSASPTIALPTASSGLNFPLTNSGTATSEGYLAQSPDGLSLTLAGYGTAPGTASIAGTASATVPRVVGKITVSTGAVDTSTALTDAYNTNNIRSAVTDGTNVWMSGNAPSAAGGTRTAPLGGTTSTQVSNSVTNTRVVKIFNNQLYVSSASGAFLGVSTVGTGIPTVAGETTTLLPGMATTGSRSTYDFWFRDSNTVYLADDGSAANGGGIQKWTLDTGAGTWSLAYTLLNTGAATTAVRGLTGVVDGADTVLYATTNATSANKLIKVIDLGASSTATDLATAPANTVFRGVEHVGSIVGPTINANFDGVGGVNGNDFLIWQQGLGTGTTLAQGDSNASGTVDATDLANWKTQFGTPAVAAAASVPEPGTLALATVVVAALARRRR